MKKSQLTRIEKLEAKIKSFAEQTLWIDLSDNRVRIDIVGEKHIRGEEITFDSVHECLHWVDEQIVPFEKVTGFAYIDDVSQLFPEGFIRDTFNEIYEGALYKNVVISLNALNTRRGMPIAALTFVTWLGWISRGEDWWKEVQTRVADSPYKLLVLLGEIGLLEIEDEEDNQEDEETKEN